MQSAQRSAGVQLQAQLTPPAAGEGHGAGRAVALRGGAQGRWGAGGLREAAHVTAALPGTSQGSRTEGSLSHPGCFHDYGETKTALWEGNEKKKNNFCSEEQILFPSFLTSFPFTDDPPCHGLGNVSG